MILQADARHIPLRDNSVQCCVTSPPYWGLRDYGVTGQLGLERTPEEYVANMVAVFREVRRVLREDGTLWLNMGDSYVGGNNNRGSGGKGPTSAKQLTNQGGYFDSPKDGFVPDGLKAKDLCGIPWRLAFALQADGWYLRSDIIWAKPNPMPESVTDRPTKSHEYIFLLTKNARYFLDQEAVREPVQPDPRDAQWGKTKQTSRHDHKHDADRGMMQTQTQADGFVRMSNPAGRNLRSVWSIATAPYPEAHFATFPPEIPKRCILAGTSAKGCCVVCGAPWERVVEKETVTPVDYEGKHSTLTDPNSAGRRMLANVRARRQAGNGHDNPFPSATTTGWRATCTCQPDTAAFAQGYRLPGCIVLDPFAGSGTTVAVAESLGRRGVGLELKPEYIALAKKRCQVTLGLPF